MNTTFFRDLTGPDDFRPFSQRAAEGSIADRFFQIASEFPYRTAVSDHGITYSYRDLKRQVKKVKAAVQGAFAGEPALSGVGLLFNASANSIIGAMGVIASGHYFCPLSLNDPPARVLTYIDDGELKLLLASRETLPAAFQTALKGFRLLFIEDILADGEQNDTIPGIDPQAICALLYTSGSTGAPKGVTHSHRSLLEMTRETVNRQKISPSDQFAGLSSISFGGFYWNMLGALLTGAGLHIYDFYEQSFGPLKVWLEDKAITYIHLTPTTLRFFLETLDRPTSFPALRLVSLGGETVLAHDVQHFYQTVMSPTILASTGATVETWFYAGVFFNRPFPESVRKIPMGYINQDFSVLIRDHKGEPLPENEVGEITVSGLSLSPGYWKREDLNAVRFPNGTNDSRYFYSGDQGLIDPQGLLYHHGRDDFQVKVRGIRVEPGEIEAVLLDHPSLKEAVVVGRQKPQGETTLVAYVVPRPEGTLTPHDVHVYLKERLPLHMIPSQFIFLDSLPLTRTFKVDRTRLPAPDDYLFQNTVKNGKPRSEVEKSIIEIWSQVLEHDRFGTKDFFIDIGGDSIQAMRIRNQLETRFGITIPLGEFIEAANVEMLAEIVERRKQNL